MRVNYKNKTQDNLEVKFWKKKKNFDHILLLRI